MKKILNYTIRNEKEETEIENKIYYYQQDCSIKIRQKDKEIAEIKRQLEHASAQLECVTRDNLNKDNEIVFKDEKNKKTIKTLQKEVDDLKSAKKELASRIGGLVRTKQNSENLIKELKETVSKLTIEKEKILKQLKQGHIKLSPKEYEQKITTVELQKAKLNSR